MLREYICKKCNEASEFIEKFEDSLQKDCPKCGEKDCLEYSEFPLSNFQLKGSGWFKTGGY